MRISKQQVIEKFSELALREFSALVESARQAHEDATHEESQSEDKHDTRAIEASYLAAGQAARVTQLEQHLQELKNFPAAPCTRAVPGALIEMTVNDRPSWALLANTGGGQQITLSTKETGLSNDVTVSIVSPHSPLGDELLDLKAGDSFTMESKNGAKEYEILWIG